MNRLLENELRIQTPEGITFSLKTAGLWHRFLAWAIDMVFIIVFSMAGSFALMMLSIVSRDLGTALQMIYAFLIMFGYPMVMEWYCDGRTYGKRFLKLRVVDAHGLRLQPAQILMRNLLRIVDALPVFYLVGGVAALFSKRGQRLGDLAANTIVLRESPPPSVQLEQILSGKYNSFRDHPHLTARLRQKTSPEGASIALDAVLRREQFDEQARVELFEAIATHFKSLVRFPEEVTLGMSDEQFVRNVVDILFSPG